MIVNLFYVPARGNNKYMVSMLDIINSDKELSKGIEEIKNEYEPILDKLEEISQEQGLLAYQRILFYFLIYQHKKGENKNDRR